MRRPIALAGAVVLAGILLAGCATGGAGPASPGEEPDPSPAATAPGSAEASGDVTIPDSYPRDDVPLADGDPVFAVDLGTGWTVILATDDLAAGFADAAGRLEAAGFTAQSHTATDDGEFSQYTDPGYIVNLTAATDPTYGKVISYTVVIAG
jgi:hypothetical protein